MATAIAAAVASVLAVLWATGTENLVDVAWLPSMGSRFILALDPLAAPLAVFVSAIAVPVFAFTAAYLPHHLEKTGAGDGASISFAGLMLAFMGAMILLILAHDLLVIFLALELTALVSFLLIRFDGDSDEARRAATLALIMTAGSSLLFLIGAAMIADAIGTTTLAGVTSGAAEVPDMAIYLLVIGVIGKSAQVPLHFWLPRAMVAPTPVSAYLHSATLVAAGVFVLQRLHFLLEQAPGLLDGLFWFAFLSIAVGGVLAFVSDEFKRILAYSTTAQYGYAVALIGAGGEIGAVAAPFFLIAHGVAKCALFMTAGAVTTATGEDRLSRSGGLAKAMPLLALGSGLAAAGLAGLPLTLGYFKDEFLIAVALDRGALAAALVGCALALTLGYIARFWFGIFGGRPRRAPAVDKMLSIPVLGLAGVAVAGGLWVAPFESAFGAAGTWIAGRTASVDFAYKFEPGPTLWLTLSAWLIGTVLALSAGRLNRLLAAPIELLSARAGLAAWSDRVAERCAALSDLMHDLEIRDMRDRIVSILVPTAAFALLGLALQTSWPRLGALAAGDAPVVAAMALCAASALAAARPAGHITFVLLLSFVGFSLALVFALLFAPNVALVLVLIEIAFTILFLALLSRIRPRVLRDAARRRVSRRGALPGVVAGAIATATAWAALSGRDEGNISLHHIALTEAAHAKDVVTAILADFRGLDTAAELTVLVIAIFGAAATAWGRRA